MKKGSDLEHGKENEMLLNSLNELELNVNGRLDFIIKFVSRIMMLVDRE